MEVEKKANSYGAYCYHQDCIHGREREYFVTQSQLTKHMRQEHDKSLYPCPEFGCKRIGGRGYTRKIDLRKHLQKEHEIMDANIEEFQWPELEE